MTFFFQISHFLYNFLFWNYFRGAKIQGPSNGKSLPVIPEYSEYIYSEPEFSWEIPIGVTAIEFPNSNDFEKYGNFLFVADTNKGIIYKFKLEETRTKFIFESPHLQDLVLNNDMNVFCHSPYLAKLFQEYFVNYYDNRGMLFYEVHLFF